MPMAIAPAFSITSQNQEFSSSTLSKHLTPPYVRVHPFLLGKKSFNANGTPANIPQSSPLSKRASSFFASIYASSNLVYTKALIDLFLSAILFSKYFNTSVGVIFLELTNCPISNADNVSSFISFILLPLLSFKINSCRVFL